MHFNNFYIGHILLRIFLKLISDFLFSILTNSSYYRGQIVCALLQSWNSDQWGEISINLDPECPTLNMVLLNFLALKAYLLKTDPEHRDSRSGSGRLSRG